ncbi:hypothetical protein [Maribacter stanieri]|uniref:hypothetical protein n=1 Tax=Maribacter stanieri TaxID=440514 RepID=UPI0030DB736E|tara:strand:- start:759 stop:1916 length:1158 start_codon:yes stop_codon:yes gene_type:complete
MKDFRVLNIVDSEMEITNQHIAIIELVEIEYIEFNLSNSDYKPYKFGTDGKRFVIDFNSQLTKSIIELAQTEQIIQLDLSEFRFQEEFKNGRKETIGYHNNVHLISFEPEQEEVFISQKLENIIQECVLYHHTDMFFNFVFRYIIDKELSSNQDISDISQLKGIFDIYKIVCPYILLESANFKTSEYKEITVSEKNHFIDKYYKLISHAKDYCDVISGYAISLDKQLIDVIESELKDKSPFFSKLEQLCLLRGYEIALKRIEKNLSSSSFFNHEIVTTENFEIIKFFPTPYGFGKKWHLIESVKNSNFFSLISNYFQEHNLEFVKDEETTNALGTKFVLVSSTENKLYYYKRRARNDNYVEFAEQDRKNPFKAILVQGQLNFTKK